MCLNRRDAETPRKLKECFRERAREPAIRGHAGRNILFPQRLRVSAVKTYCTGITIPVGDVFPPIDIVIAWFPAGIFVGTCTLIW